MALTYLASDLEVDTNEVVEAIQTEAISRRIANPQTILAVEDQEVTVETITQKIIMSTGLDPFRARRAAARIVKNKFAVPVYAIEIQYIIEEYLRMNKGKLPVKRIVALVQEVFARNEDAYFFTATANTNIPGDFEGIAATGNFRAPTSTLIANDYDTGVSSLAAMINDLVNGISGQKGMKGLVRQNPMILIVNADVESNAAGTLQTTSSETLLSRWIKMLVERGGPGSRIEVSDFLACTIAVNDNNEVTVTETLSNAALVCVTPRGFATYNSIIEQRTRPLTKADGYYNKIVNRYLNLVHNPDAIIFEDGVTVT
ncbi:MAG: hypothetical protein V3V41_07875 [Candidatus Heimdallarchaeota archaeon]